VLALEREKIELDLAGKVRSLIDRQRRQRCLATKMFLVVRIAQQLEAIDVNATASTIVLDGGRFVDAGHELNLRLQPPPAERATPVLKKGTAT
jgi:hypothetical protein